MKRIMIFSFVIILILSLNFFTNHYLVEIFNDKIDTYYVYSNTKNDINGMLNVEVVNNGNGQILKTNKQNSKKLCCLAKQIGGECVKLRYCNLNYVVEKLGLKIIEISSVGNNVCVLGYSKLLRHSLYLNNKKINIQIVQKDDSILVGYPLILQGF